ncbi:hypothetical protein OG897_40700 [Streptomyces sp. NBC_00237]|nr:hypothetical protein [Streptomyces sp. NBC_00237]MCX5207705.1 hypothetical protein [Streptomyces sp. NBC_00237]
MSRHTSPHCHGRSMKLRGHMYICAVCKSERPRTVALVLAVIGGTR